MTEAEKKTVLIADDEEIICKPLRIFFEKKGYFALTASNGEEAYQFLKTMKVDVLVADLRMPKLDGIALTNKAKKINPHLPVIILSGAGSIEEATVAIKTGAFDYIQKPIMNMDDLERIVARAIDRSDLEKRQEILQKNLQEKTKKLEEKVIEINQAKEQLERHSFYLQRALEMIEQQNIQMEEDLKNAQHIQEDLLPKELPRGEHFSFASRYIPSGKVGGDMFDAFIDPAYVIHLYVADVAGHGVGAAMVTVFLKKTITPFQHFTDINTTPRDILSLLNGELIKAGFGKRLFVTMFYATFNPSTRQFTFASAGHPPFILKSPGKKPKAFSSEGISLGWKAEPEFIESSITLQQGDRLLFYTDGLIDAFVENDKHSEGLDKILKVFNKEEYHSKEADFIIKDILNATGKSDNMKDDISLLVLSL